MRFFPLLSPLVLLAGLLGASRAEPAAAPVVEIQINHTSDPRAAYITWAPTFCRARQKTGKPGGADLTVTLSNAVTNDRGRVVFAAAQDPWPANTTASEPTLQLTLPGDCSWREFVIAGDYPHASLADKDTAIVATAAGVEVGLVHLMVRVRKDARTLTLEERDRFLNAVARLHLVDRGYEIFFQIHYNGLPEAHGGPAFLPWHRTLVLQVERALQKVDPSVTLPYWKFSEPAPTVFTEEFMGADSPDGQARFLPGHPLVCWNISGYGGIYRGCGPRDRALRPHLTRVGEPPILSDDLTLAPDAFHHINPVTNLEDGFHSMEITPHGYAHNYGGDSDGWMGSGPLAPRDPLFWLLHSNVERLWAAWQHAHDRFGGSSKDFWPEGHYPGPKKGSLRLSHYLEETMWPWNGRVGEDPRFPGDPGATRPAEALGGPFPPAAPFLLGPPPHPRLADVIDYPGRKDPKQGLGYAYDTIPFAPLAKPLEPAPRRSDAGRAALAVFLDPEHPLDRRLASVRSVGHVPAEDAGKLMRVVLDTKADPHLRIAAIGLVGFGDEKPFARDLFVLLRNKSTPVELRRRATYRVGFLLDTAPTGNIPFADYFAVGRELLDDLDQLVRDLALVKLVAHNDPPSIARLIASLDDPGHELQPTAQALRTLTQAEHPDGYEVIRKHFEGSADVAVRTEAARGLGRFDKGREALRKAVLSPEQPGQVRLTALQALHANDSLDFPDLALKVLQHEKAPAELRCFALSALAYHVASARIRADQPASSREAEITTMARGLAVKAKEPVLRLVAWQYLALNDPHFLRLAPNFLRAESDAGMKPRLQAMYLREQARQVEKVGHSGR